MATPYLSEIRLVSFNFPPEGWALCDGQLMPINQNQALFSLLGTTYGGNGTTTFALPNLQGRIPLHVGAGRALGETGGEATHTLVGGEIPTHTHTVAAASGTGAVASPAGAYWAGIRNANAFSNTAAPSTPLDATVIGPYGGGQPHQNMPPYLVLNFVIALVGIFPTRT